MHACSQAHVCTAAAAGMCAPDSVLDGLLLLCCCRVNYPADKGDFAKNPDGSVTFWLSYAPPGPKGSPKYQNW